MARGRILSRQIAIDIKFNKLTISQQWLFMRLLPFTDDYGRVNGNLEELHLQMLPAYKDFEVNKMRSNLNALQKAGMIEWKENIVIQFINFNKHQKIGHRRAKSEYPSLNGEVDVNIDEEKKEFRVVNGKILAHCSKCDRDYYFRYDYETQKESPCCKVPFKP